MDTPKHIALILDGNRRWAKAHNIPTFKGHQAGIDRVKDIVEACQEIGVEALSLYCFSTENWKRTEDEIKYLMKLFTSYLKKHLDSFHKQNVKIVHLGRKDRIPHTLKTLLEKAEQETQNNTSITVQFAIDYGGRDEIIRAIETLRITPFDKLKNQCELRENHIADALDSKTYSNVDLLIRTSGEQRLSNFMLWQLAYAELMFIPEYFPDFTQEVFMECIEEYKQRKRRYGS
jgi:undecaprenyl diphosphate synthase